MTQLIEYPQLPLLPLEKCFAVFARAGITPTQLPKLSGFTRMALYKWREKKVDARFHSQDRVSVLAYKTLRAIKHKTAPFKPGADIDYILQCLNDNAESKPLSDYQPEELLPEAWLTQLTAEV